MNRTATILKDGRNILVNHPVEVDDNNGGGSGNESSRFREISGSFYMNRPPRFAAADVLEIILDDGWHGNVRLSDIQQLPSDGRYFIAFSSPGKTSHNL